MEKQRTISGFDHFLGGMGAIGALLSVGGLVLWWIAWTAEIHFWALGAFGVGCLLILPTVIRKKELREPAASTTSGKVDDAN